MSGGVDLKAMRRLSGLTQAGLAARIGTSQSRLSTYENGSVQPSAAVLARIADAARPLPSLALDANRSAILDAAARHGLSDIRVFGSVAKGEDHIGSDIDLLVTPGPATSLVDLSGFRLEVQQLTGCGVDVVTDGALPVGSEIVSEALPL